MLQNTENTMNISVESMPNFWQMEKWITSKIYDPNGGIYSWQRGDKKGYLYNEITGYGIKLYTCLYDIFKEPRYIQMAKKSVNYIGSQINKSGGGISRGGIYYVFDASMCLSGILSYYDNVNNYVEKKMAKDLLNFIYNGLLNKRPINLNGASQDNLDMNHWSLSYGSHLLKCCIALSQSSNIFENEREKLDILVDRICLDILHNFHNGHFHKNSSSKDVYTHSHCYATEGLIYLGRQEYLKIIQESASWLASVQNPNGSLYNRYFSSNSQEEVADATSQAIRIWLWTDKDFFSANIEKGFNFLRSLQSPEGGIYYKSGSKDINSWVTMFTMNAVLWSNNVNPKWLI
jgi:hypothetical protein